MKKSLQVILTFVIMTSFIPENNKENIRWSEDKKLMPADFKGIPEKDSTMRIAALSSVEISSEYRFTGNHDSLFCNIYAVFYTHESWMRSEFTRDGSVSEEVLSHEQGHFDITEIYARIFRKSLCENELKKEKVQEQTESMYNQFFNELETTQQLYDQETSNVHMRKNKTGIIQLSSDEKAKQQKKWNDKINKELKELEKYSNTELKLHVAKQ